MVRLKPDKIISSKRFKVIFIRNILVQKFFYSFALKSFHFGLTTSSFALETVCIQVTKRSLNDKALYDVKSSIDPCRSMLKTRIKFPGEKSRN